MAFTTIQSAGSLYEGTDSAELIVVESGAAARTTINAAGGNDTLQMILSGTPGASVTAFEVDMNAGADFIDISGNQGIFDSTVIAGAGSDTLNFQSGGSVVETTLKLGDGSDYMSSELVDVSGTNFNFGAGADTLNFIGDGNATGATFAAGAGADELAFARDIFMSAVTVLGGGGADLIQLSGEAGGGSLINGDSSANGGGADTIAISAAVAVSASTVKGKGGSDEIIISGNLSNSARVEGNAGGDLITIEEIAGDNAFIGGGSGNDTIQFTGGVVNNSATIIKGGGGADSISLIGDVAGTATKIYGGAGSDTIELGDLFSGVGDGTMANADASGIISFTDLSDSDLGSIDVVSGAAAISGLIFALDTAAGITSFTVGAYNDSDEDTPSITAGIASGGSWESADSTVTARATQLDELVTKAGTVVSFTANSLEYLFIQGGTSGTDDDAVVKISMDVSGIEVAEDYMFNVNVGNG